MRTRTGLLVRWRHEDNAATYGYKYRKKYAQNEPKQYLIERHGGPYGNTVGLIGSHFTYTCLLKCFTRASRVVVSTSNSGGYPELKTGGLCTDHSSRKRIRINSRTCPNSLRQWTAQGCRLFHYNSETDSDIVKSVSIGPSPSQTGHLCEPSWAVAVAKLPDRML